MSKTMPVECDEINELVRRVENERETFNGRFTIDLKRDLLAAAENFGKKEIIEACKLGAATLWSWKSQGITPRKRAELPDCACSGTPMTFRVQYNEEEPSTEEQPEEEPSTVIEITTKKGTVIKIYE